MKKILSIALSLLLIAGTMSVLTTLNVAADSSAPVNLITNGDASGVTVDNNIKYLYDAADETSAVYPGEKKTGNVYGWRNTNGSLYANTQLNYPLVSDYGKLYQTYSNFSPTKAFKLNVSQQAFQDVEIEAGKTYRVSAKMTVMPMQSSNNTCYFDMLLDEKAGTISSAASVSGKDWNAVVGHGQVENDVRALCYTNNPELSTVVIDSHTYVLGDYDFKDYSFTFDSDDFIAEKNLTAKANGKYDARLCIINSTSNWLTMDDITMYAIRDITAAIDPSCTNGGTISVPDYVNDGESATFTASPFYGNTFLGWYDQNGKLASSETVFTTIEYNNLTAKFGVYNQIYDGSFTTSAIGDTAPTALSNLANYHTSNLPTFEIVENTDNADVLGSKVLKYTSVANAAGQAAGQLDILIPVTVEKNTKYIFKFYYKNTSSRYVGFTLLANNTWDGHATVDYSAYYGIYGTKSSNVWSYGRVNGKLKENNIATKTHGAAYSNTGWNEMYVIFDSLENEGTIYATIGMSASCTDSVAYLSNLLFAELVPAYADGETTVTDGGSYKTTQVSAGADATDYKFTTGAWGQPIAYEDTAYHTAGYEYTYKATPSYGNGFLGWYSGNTLVSSDIEYTGSDEIIARFDKRNLITNGSYEEAEIKDATIAEYQAYPDYSTSSGTVDIVSNSGLTNTDTDKFGNNCLKITPDAGTGAGKRKSLLNIPVTVEKNTDYVWRFSYKFNGITDYNNAGRDYIHFMIDSVDSNGKIPWAYKMTNASTYPSYEMKYTFHSQRSQVTTPDTYAYSWGGTRTPENTAEDFGFETNNGCTGDQNYWVDMYILFNPLESSGVFAEGSNTGTVYLTLGTPDAQTNPIYFDNMSCTKATYGITPSTVSTNGDGTAAAYRFSESLYYTSVVRGNSAVCSSLDTTKAYYPQIYTPVKAVPDKGHTFLGWYDSSNNVVSRDPEIYVYSEGKNLTAKFAERADKHTITANLEKLNGVYGGYLTGDTTISAVAGDSVTVSAVPYVGNTFDGWYADGRKISGEAQYSFTVLKSINLTARFNINNLWPDSGYENTVTDTELLLDKVLADPTLSEYDWYSGTPSNYWHAYVKTEKPYTGNNSLELTHRFNTVYKDISGLQKNTDYEFSFYWYIRNAHTTAPTPSSLSKIQFIGSDSLPISDYNIGTVYSEDFQKTTVRFNSGDSTMVSVGIIFSAGSSSIVCDDFCLAAKTDTDYVTVSYNSGDEKTPNNTEHVQIGSSYTVKAPLYKVPGKTFANWSYNGGVYNTGNTITVGDSNITLTANWTDVNYGSVFSDSSSLNPDDIDYSFIVMPDEQKVNSLYPGYYNGITQWIADNASAYNIKGVMSVGDLTEGNTMEEWRRARSAFSLLDGVTPYITAPGNHDYVNGKTKGTYSATNERNVDYFESQFKVSDYSAMPEWGGAYDDSLINCYYKINAGSRKYIMMSLEIYPRDTVLDWANGVADANPDYQLIVTTHSYLNANGTRTQPTDNGGSAWYVFNNPEDSNGADEMWDKFLSKHSNILMVVSGHCSSSQNRCNRVIGDNGNTVYELLIDNQDDDVNYSGVGNIVIMGFSEDGSKISFTDYSTIKEKYFRTDVNDFSINADKIIDKTGNGYATYTTAADGNTVRINYKAQPYNGNIFLGWYDDGGNLVSKNREYSATGYACLTAKFEGFNSFPNGDFEHDSDLSMFCDYKNILSIESYDEPSTEYGSHYLKYETVFRNSVDGSVKLPVEKNTDYSLSFKMKIADITALTRIRFGFASIANSWGDTAILGGCRQVCSSTVSDYSFTSSVNAGLAFRSTIDITALNNDTKFGHDWIDVTFFFNSGSDSTVFADGDSGYLYLQISSLYAGSSLMLDNFVFSGIQTVTAAAEAGGTANADKQTVIPGNDVTFTASPDYSYSFKGWYYDGKLVSSDRVFTTGDYINLTAKFTGYNLVADGGFENGIGQDSWKAVHGTGVTFENVTHNSEEDPDLGSKYMKATDTAGSYVNFYVSAPVEANKKYIVHFNYKVEAETPSRTDIRISPKADWGQFTDAYFYASSATYSYAPTDGHNAFGMYQSDKLMTHFGGGWIEMTAIVNTGNELLDGNLYLLLGAKTGAQFLIDNVSVIAIDDIAPSMLGSTLVGEHGVYEENTIAYKSHFNFIPSFLKMTELGTIAMPSQLIGAGNELTTDTVNVSSAKISDTNGLTLDVNSYYSIFKNSNSISNSVKLSARSYVVFSDKYGKFSWKFYSTNDNSSMGIANGTYNRSVTQVKRLIASNLVSSFAGKYPSDFFSDDDVTETSNVKSSSSVSADKVWNFVKRNSYLFSSASFTNDENYNLINDGSFENDEFYVGAQRTLIVDTDTPYASGNLKGVAYDYDEHGWVYCTSGGFFKSDTSTFENFFKIVDSSEIRPNTGDHCLKINTRAGIASYVLRDLKPNTDYELSYYWFGTTSTYMANTYVYPYDTEFNGYTYSEENTTIDNVSYRLYNHDVGEYYMPDELALNSRSLDFIKDRTFANNTWQKVTLKFNTGYYSEAVLGINYASVQNAGTIYVDDLCLTETEPSHEVLTNGSFDNGLKDWTGAASTYKIAGDSAATFNKRGNMISQTVDVDRYTDYVLTVRAKTLEPGALLFGVTNISYNDLIETAAISNTARCITDKTGINTYTISFNSGSYKYIRLFLKSLSDTKSSILSVTLEEPEDNIIYDEIDFEDSYTSVGIGTAPQYAIAKTNDQWFSIQSNVAHTGKSSLLMSATSTDTNAQTDYTMKDGTVFKHPLYQDWTQFVVKSGTYYKISYYAKAAVAGTSYISAVNSTNQDTWEYLYCVDKKTVTLNSTDWTLVENTFVINGFTPQNNFINLVIAGNETTNSNIWFDDIVISETAPLISDTSPEALYTEALYNLIPNNDFEKTTDDYNASNMSIASAADAYSGERYLRVNAGEKFILPIKTRVEYNFVPSVVYTFSAAIRKSAAGNGYVGISYTGDGSSFYVDQDENPASVINADSTAWTFSGFSYTRETVSPTYLVIECTNGYIDVDMLSLFTDEHAFTSDPNIDSKPYYDYNDLSSAIMGGGTTVAGATSLSVNNTTAGIACDTYTGLSNSVYHAIIFDNVGRDYTEEQWDLELTRMKNAGITMVRTMFRAQWAYTGDESNPWDWESDEMLAFYDWCKRLDSYGIDVAINVGFHLAFYVYGTGSIPDVQYLSPRKLDENGNIQYTISWGIMHELLDNELAYERYAEWGTQAIKAIFDHGVTNMNHVVTFTEPSHPNGTLYRGAFAALMLAEVETLVDKMNATYIDDENTRTIRSAITLIGPNQANGTNAGLADYMLQHSKYGINLYDIWTSHYVPKSGDTPIGTVGDTYQMASTTYNNMMTNYRGIKRFWMDEWASSSYFGGAYNGTANYDDTVCRWWPVCNAGSYTALMNAGLSGGILWMFTDEIWSYLNGGSGGEFEYGIHKTGTTPSVLTTQTPYYIYYMTSLLTKYMTSGMNGITYVGSSGNDYVHVSCVKRSDGEWSVLVVNQQETDSSVKLSFANSIGGKNMYRHVYEASTVTPDSHSRIIEADKVYAGVTTSINDTIPAGSVVVYTSVKG